MGLIFIIPFIAIFAWIIISTWKNLRVYEATVNWRVAYWILFILGIGLGIWLPFFQNMRLPEMILHGMPIPLTFERLVGGNWVMNEPPLYIQAGALIGDFLAGIALLIFPFKVFALIKHFRKAVESPS